MVPMDVGATCRSGPVSSVPSPFSKTQPGQMSTTGVGKIWRSAIIRYEETTQNKLDLSQAHNVADILGDIQGRENQFKRSRHDKSRTDRFRSRISKSLGPIGKLCEIVSRATSAFAPSEPIFAAIKHLISTANSVSADYDKVADFFEDLSSYLLQLKVLEVQLTSFSEELEITITEVFTSVLLMFGICTKQIKMKRIVKALRALMSGEDDELKTAYDHFRKMVQREKALVSNITLSRVESVQKTTVATHADVQEGLDISNRIDKSTGEIGEDVKQMRQKWESQERSLNREKIQQWLSPLDFREKQRTVFAKHQKGTGSWFLNSDAFQGWFRSKHGSALWCSGNPGTGKTVITSIAINHVEEVDRKSKFAIVYAYCDYKDPKTLSEGSILSCLAKQLVQQSTHVPQEAEDFYRRFLGANRSPTDEDKISLINNLSKYFDITYLFIDALDECPEKQRGKFLRLARGLLPCTNLCITSRPNVQVNATLKDIVKIDIVAKDSDIRVYLEAQIEDDDRLCRLTQRDRALKEDIISVINTKASGMFLLADLQLKEICLQLTPKKVRRSLAALPNEIYDSYEAIMMRINSQKGGDPVLSGRILSFVFCAIRPLTIEELRHALAVGETVLDDDDLPDEPTLLSITAGLLRIDEKTKEAQFVHHTLQEYFEKHPEQLLPQPEVEFAKSCIEYLLLEAFEDGACVSATDLERRLTSYPFLEYAAHNWGYHVKQSQSHQWEDIIFNLLLDENRRSTFVQVLYVPPHRPKNWHDRFPKLFTSLHATAYWGLERMLPQLLESKIGIDDQNTYGMTALHLSAQNGHQSVTQSLVHLGADLNILTHKQETPLLLAAKNGRQNVTELLVANGAKTLMEDEGKLTPLNWAAIGGHDNVVEKLLASPAHIDPTDDIKHQALCQAAEGGHTSTVQILLDNNVEINWKDPRGCTALTWALPEDREAVVQLLLDNGIDVNTTDIYSNRPLHWVLQYPKIARLLLDHGAEINASNEEGQTALLWCALGGDVGVLRLLLQNNADINIQDRYGFTALHASSLEGHQHIVDLLLENSAKPDQKDQDGWTPLHAALLKHNHEIAQKLQNLISGSKEVTEQVTELLKDDKQRAIMEELAERKSKGSTVAIGLRAAANQGIIGKVQELLDSGAHIDTVDPGGSSALTVAVQNNEQGIVQLLLEHGADPNICERYGRSALHFACASGREGLVRLLVENGAFIDAQVHMWTPLLQASRQGHNEIVKYLIKKGASVNAEDYHGRRALHWASKRGSTAIAQVLIDHGTDPNAQDRWGKTALIWSIVHQNAKVSYLLLESNADVHLKTQEGFTALHLATYHNDKTAVRQLLSRGANFNEKTSDNITPLSIAVGKGHKSIIRLLRQSLHSSESDADRMFDDPDERLCKAYENLTYEDDGTDTPGSDEEGWVSSEFWASDIEDNDDKRGFEDMQISLRELL